MDTCFALVRAHQQGKDKSMEKRIERVALNFSSTQQYWDLLHLLSWKRWNGKRPCNIALLAKVMFLQIRCLQAADLMSVHVSVCRKLLGNNERCLWCPIQFKMRGGYNILYKNPGKKHPTPMHTCCCGKPSGLLCSLSGAGNENSDNTLCNDILGNREVNSSTSGDEL